MSFIDWRILVTYKDKYETGQRDAAKKAGRR